MSDSDSYGDHYKEKDNINTQRFHYSKNCSSPFSFNGSRKVVSLGLTKLKGIDKRRRTPIQSFTPNIISESIKEEEKKLRIIYGNTQNRRERLIKRLEMLKAQITQKYNTKLWQSKINSIERTFTLPKRGSANEKFPLLDKSVVEHEKKKANARIVKEIQMWMSKARKDMNLTLVSHLRNDLSSSEKMNKRNNEKEMDILNHLEQSKVKYDKYKMKQKQIGEEIKLTNNYFTEQNKEFKKLVQQENDYKRLQLLQRINNHYNKIESLRKRREQFAKFKQRMRKYEAFKKYTVKSQLAKDILRYKVSLIIIYRNQRLIQH